MNNAPGKAERSKVFSGELPPHFALGFSLCDRSTLVIASLSLAQAHFYLGPAALEVYFQRN